MTEIFTGKGAIVTGAASGIGRAIAGRLLAGGASQVAFLDKNPRVSDIALETARQLGRDPEVALGLQTDISRSESIDQTFASLEASMVSIDMVVHAAATSAGGNVLTLQEQDWRAVIDTDLTSAFLIARAAIPHLVETRGNIVFVASQLGLVGTRDSVAYTAAKGGLINLTRSLALDHAAAGVRVNCLCPGPTSTPMLDASFARTGHSQSARNDSLSRIPLGRFGTPEEIANGAAFLCSEEASFVTGVALVVDGGYLAQ